MSRDASLVTILLVSRLCADGLEPLKNSEYRKLLKQLKSEPLTSDVALLAERSGIPAERLTALLNRANALAFELERLDRVGIRTLTHLDEKYPQSWRERLSGQAPAVIHAAGELQLLNLPGLGVVGSRDVSGEGGEVAKEAARIAARRGLCLVSGGARGVDRLAMGAARECGGSVVGILAESLSRRLNDPEVRRAIHDEAAIMCTPYSPNVPFRAGNAMGRNKLIYALAEMTVVIASDHNKGGTWAGATEALKRGFGNVAVWRGKGEGPGNEHLEGLGAQPIRNLDQLESALDNPDRVQRAPLSPSVQQPEEQLALL